MKNVVKNPMTYAGMLLLFCGFLWMPSGPRVVYIDNTKLFDAFEMKKDLENTLNRSNTARQFTLDSLKAAYSSWSKEADSVAASGKNTGLLLMKSRQYESYIREQEQQMREVSAAQAADFDKKIWTRLNQYVNDYGIENGYDMVFGANGSGNIMYGAKAMDKTAEMIRYVNKKYTGKP